MKDWICLSVRYDGEQQAEYLDVEVLRSDLNNR